MSQDWKSQENISVSRLFHLDVPKRAEAQIISIRLESVSSTALCAGHLACSQDGHMEPISKSPSSAVACWVLGRSRNITSQAFRQNYLIQWVAELLAIARRIEPQGRYIERGVDTLYAKGKSTSACYDG